MTQSRAQQLTQHLPHTPGVYLFYSEESSTLPLYIGKSIDIKQRVLSHFYQMKSHPKEQKLMRRVNTIDYQTTAGEMGALLLEASLVKKHKPLYNRQLRRCRQLCYFALNKKTDYFSIECQRDKLSHFNLDSNHFGWFTSQKQAIDFIRDLAKKQQLCLIKLGIDKGRGSCFNYQLGQCRGACCGQENPAEFNLRLLDLLKTSQHQTWPFSGAIGVVEKNELQKMKDVHWIDQWRYINTVSLPLTSPISRPCELKAIEFDRDHYKIIRHFLKKDNNTDFSIITADESYAVS